MELRTTDFNGADRLVQGTLKGPWKEIEEVLADMPLHIKASDKAGKQGSPIFDPVGTNVYITKMIIVRSADWLPCMRIPTSHRYLGKDIDFARKGMLVESQFSNYPFLANNVARAEVFFREELLLPCGQTRLLVIITKAGVFPASNSTLYYEQAVKQVTAWTRNGLFSMPIRLVGLFAPTDSEVAVRLIKSPARYSRDISASVDKTVRITVAGRRRIIEIIN